MGWWRHLPNALSGLRLALVPVLLGLAWTGRQEAFLWCFGAALASDVVDGFVARRFSATSEAGARLDSWGDLATYAVLPLCAWWLWPDRVLAKLTLVAIGLVCFAAPTAIGLLKFGRITSYHTYLAKLVANVLGAALVLYVGFGVGWLFDVAVILLVLEAVEEIAITAVLPEARSNVHSLAHALAIARGGAPGDGA
jgi:CDP-diacylglycerol--glycerol-3-phosphate 3-phosphatidyltransferase